MFGNVEGLTVNNKRFLENSENEIEINENFPFNPQSPYATSKVAAYYIVKLNREAFKIFICQGLTFNHESPFRHEDFLTRKVTKAVARIKYEIQDVLELGNINSIRDWGHAFDYIRGFWLMLNA